MNLPIAIIHLSSSVPAKLASEFPQFPCTHPIRFPQLRGVPLTSFFQKLVFLKNRDKSSSHNTSHIIKTKAVLKQNYLSGTPSQSQCRVKLCTRSMIRAIVRSYRHLSTLSLPNQHPPRPNLLFQSNKKLQELMRLGRIDDARRLFDEMTHRDAVTWNSMITGYSQHGRLDEARVLFESFGGKNVRTWTALLTGYAKNGRVEEARLVFDDMPERNIVSWNAMVSGYVQNGDLWNARKLFDEMPERNVASWNSIVGGYCRLCMMDEARGLFDGMPERNSVSWMVMISGYVESSGFREAWILFVRMHRSGCRPDQSVFVVAISAITGLNDLELLSVLRTVAMKTGHEEDVVVGTAILNAYTRCGCLEVAVQFFELMPEWNEYSWTSMIAAFSQCGKFDNAIALYNRVPEKSVSMKTVAMTAYARIGRIGEAKRIFDEIPTPNVIAWNSMVAGYAQNGMLEEAKDLFLRMPMRNSASWAAMIAGLVLNGRSKEAFNLLAELHRSGAVPSPSTFTSILSACANTRAIEMGRQLHCLSIKAGCQFNQHVGNGLMSMYAKCKNMEDVSQVFSKMRRRDTVSWNSLITGYSENNMLGDARNTFEKMPERDVVSWTAIISAYVQSDQGEIALELFLGMLANGIKPNELVVTSLLSTCGSLGLINLGEQFHALICKLGFDSFICVGNSLITMYFKCGCEDGVSAFEQMGEKDIVTWNAILAGCAQNGFGDEGIKIFEKMKGKGVVPDHISFLGLLSACSHSGLVDEGLNYFTSMTQDYGIMPLVQHYTCMVDLLGRAGRLSIAESVIENIPVEPDLVIWEALLVACRIHRNFKLGQKVAERLVQMGTEKYGPYVLLLDIYASQGMQDKVGEIQKAMFDRGVSEKPGFSWIQIKSKLHCFLTGDETHNQIQGIHTELMNFYGNFQALVYVPDTNFLLGDVAEEQKQTELLYHSVKLSVTFGILNTPNGSTIRIMKNLRICGDCHSFVKYMSKINRRKIVIRDGNRLHHFWYGLCSCGDYW